MIFGKKRCKDCGGKLEKKWNFCPHCGKGIKYKSIFDDVDKEFERMEKVFELPKIDLKPRVDGVSIIISSGMKPKMTARKAVEKPVKIPKFTEEPETTIERRGNRQIINIKLPGVKKEDIEIKRLEQSIEIKAFAGDKAYFKLIPIPSSAAVNRSFEDEMLKIEVLK